MGIYFNPNNEGFRQAVKSRIYVDKTGLLDVMNSLIGTEEKCVALSHARRFGKSQAARMIDAYYSVGSDSRELFSKYKIAQSSDFEKHLNQYNVIHLDVASFTDHYKDGLVENMWKMVYNEIAEIYPAVMDRSKSAAAVLAQTYAMSGRKFVIIIDEWDCVVRNHADRPDLVHEYLQFLHAVFKSEESQSFLALGYITGILPIKKIQDESALNNFKEYTMLNSKKLTPYYGFTENEVKALCEEYHMNFDSMKQWYDGYLIRGMHMYNPNSVVSALLDEEFDSYWKNTSSFDTINRYIEMDFDGLKDDIMTMLEGGETEVNTYTFRNDLSEIHSKDDALTALIHLGYLGYDADSGTAFIPNYEVKVAFQAALSTGAWKEISRSISQCEKLLGATIRGNSERVAELVEIAHETYTSILKYNDENSLSCCLTMAYFTAPAYYNVIREFPSGKGFADIVMIPRADTGNKPAMIIELKYDQEADSAIRQIREKRYTGALKGYGDEVLLVGISYDKEAGDKKHNCIIERNHL